MTSQDTRADVGRFNARFHLQTLQQKRFMVAIFESLLPQLCTLGSMALHMDQHK